MRVSIVNSRPSGPSETRCLDTLLQLIECRPAAQKKRTSVDRRLNAARSSSKSLTPKQFKIAMTCIRPDGRHGGRSLVRLRLHNRKENAEVAPVAIDVHVVRPIAYLATSVAFHPV